MLLAASLIATVLVLPHAEPALDKAPARTAARPAEAGKGEKVEVTTEDQVKIHAAFFAPKSPKGSGPGGSVPGVLLIHDAGAARGQLEDLADKLQKQGFAVLALDLRGQGESVTAESDWSKLDDEHKKTMWASSIGDLKAGLAFLRSKSNVQAASLSIVGYRSGCTLVARYAQRDESVRAIALLDPQPEQFGLNLMKDVEALGGLPTFVAVAKDDQSSGQRLSDAVERGARQRNGDAVQVFVAKEDSGATLSDKRVTTEVVKWLAARTAPAQKGRH